MDWNDTTIRQYFPSARPSGSGYEARCPAHDDRNPSLSIGVGDRGNLLLDCHAHCAYDDILRAVGLTRADAWPSREPARRIVAVYTYRATTGDVLFEVVRFEPKTFRIRRPSPDGTSVWNAKGVERVPYHLERLAQESWKSVFVCEGEKDVDRLWSLGLPATTNPGGAGHWTLAYSQQLKTLGVQRLCVIPDHDDQGAKHGEQVAGLSTSIGLETRVLALPGLQAKGADLSDWLAAGHTAQELQTLARTCPCWCPNGNGSYAVDEGSAWVGLKALEPPADLSALQPMLEALRADGGEQPALERALRREALARELKRLKIRATTPILDVVYPAPERVAPEDAPMLTTPIEPWADPVDGYALLRQLINLLNRYVVFPTGDSAIAVALWVLHTYGMALWSVSPFLLLTSPVKRCGKTLVLFLLEQLTSRALLATHVTPAVIFRTIDEYHPTLLLDEVETWLDDDKNELRGLLNAGYTRASAQIPRCVGDEHHVQLFSTWSPKVLAMIGAPNPTLIDRSVRIPMQRKRRIDRVDRLRLDRLPQETGSLRQQMVRWMADAESALRAADPDVPDVLNDRAADNWRPLLALADVIGGDVAGLARQAAMYLESGALDVDELGTMLLRDVRDYFDAHPDDSTVPTTTLLCYLNTERVDRPWGEIRRGQPLSAHGLSRLLRPYFVHSRSNGSLREYRRAAFDEAFDRYLPSARNPDDGSFLYTSPIPPV
jgi:putative DNA primase/helicase